MTYLYKRNGFTLVELAIVITIIGILIGGVLKGQQLIDNARVAATISQVQGYKTALPIFYSTYDALPGDMADAEKRIINCSGCVASDFSGDAKLEDGRVGYNYAYNRFNPSQSEALQNTLASEPTRFWLHLYKANLISGISDAALSGTNAAFAETHPAAKIGGGFSVGEGRDTENSGQWGAYSRIPNGLIMLLHQSIDAVDGVMSPQQAAAIDRKIDDGHGDSGSIWANGGNCTTGNYPNTEYRENRDYKQACYLGFIMDY